MRIAIINVPFEAPWLGQGQWITVPPQGYGGIQWNVANLIDGLVERGHELFLLGAPGSPSRSERLHVVGEGSPEGMRRWLGANDVDLVHDFSDGVVPLQQLSPERHYLTTFHLNGRPKNPRNVVFVSYAQRRSSGGRDAPVIRVPINPERCHFAREKHDYLLFLGRVSPWKGTLEAAQFAQAAGLPLIVAGPSWEHDYRDTIAETFGSVVSFVGEVGGERRLSLLARAKAVLVLSQPVPGPDGAVWSEPGATVVSEAAASGTPSIATDNGCLAEIVPLVGRVLVGRSPVTPKQARAALQALPSPDAVRDLAIQEWGHRRIAREYETLYTQIVGRNAGTGGDAGSDR